MVCSTRVRVLGHTSAKSSRDTIPSTVQHAAVHHRADDAHFWASITARLQFGRAQSLPVQYLGQVQVYDPTELVHSAPFRQSRVSVHSLISTVQSFPLKPLWLHGHVYLTNSCRVIRVSDRVHAWAQKLYFEVFSAGQGRNTWGGRRACQSRRGSCSVPCSWTPDTLHFVRKAVMRTRLCRRYNCRQPSRGSKSSCSYQCA